MPKVSVIIRVYNRIKYLPLAIKSVLNQSLQDFEIILIDDGSKDDVFRIVSRFEDRRIKYIKNSSNLGHTTALKIGIENSTGEYIAILDSDDIYLKDHLHSSIKYMDKYNILFGTQILISSNNSMIKNGINLWKRIILKKQLPWTFDIKSVYDKFLFGWSLGSGSCFIFKRNNILYEKLKYIIHYYNNFFLSDILMIAMLTQYKKVALCNKQTVLLRIHSENIGRKYMYLMKDIDEMIYIIKNEHISTTFITNVTIYLYYILSSFFYIFWHKHSLRNPQIFIRILIGRIIKTTKIFFL